MIDRVELAATILLSVAAVATAWSSYQATRWNGEQAKASSRTNAIRIDAARAQGLAEAQTQVDVATFTSWVDAYARDETELADFYFERFRAEFKPAVEAWIARRPLRNPDAPLTPFAMPQYRLEATAEAERLDEEAAASAALVQRNIQRSSNYVLAVVLFAVSLFFGTPTEHRSCRRSPDAGSRSPAAIAAAASTTMIPVALRSSTLPISRAALAANAGTLTCRQPAAAPRCTAPAPACAVAISIAPARLASAAPWAGPLAADRANRRPRSAARRARGRSSRRCCRSRSWR